MAIGPPIIFANPTKNHEWMSIRDTSIRVGLNENIMSRLVGKFQLLLTLSPLTIV